MPLNRLSLLTRQKVDTDGQSLEDYSHHLYPFDTLPLLESHLHPKFVIFNSGSKLDKMGHTSLEKHIDKFPSLSKVLTVYKTWITPIQKEEVLKDVSFHYCPIGYICDDVDEDDSDYDDHKTNRTKSGRAGIWSTRDWKREPSLPRAVKRKRSNPRTGKVICNRSVYIPPLLSKATLSSFDQQIGDAAWTNISINQWSLGLHV